MRPVHPGLTLKSELEARHMSASALTRAIHVPSNRLTDIIRGRRNITADTALLLGDFFGNPAEFWMTLQANYDLSIARQKRQEVGK